MKFNLVMSRGAKVKKSPRRNPLQNYLPLHKIEVANIPPSGNIVKLNAAICRMAICRTSEISLGQNR
jgi:hypothetical protein